MRGALACAILLGCAGDDPTGGPPPLPTSPVTTVDAGGDAATPVVDAGGEAVTWSGSLAKTDKASFGGDPYCNYEVVLSNVKVDLTISSDRTIASGAVIPRRRSYAERA